MTVKVSPKYQVVIPQEIRRILGLRPGTKVDVIAKGKVAYLVPVSSVEELQNDLQGKVQSSHIRDKGNRKL